jgi:GntR family transcriptional regulator
MIKLNLDFRSPLPLFEQLKGQIRLLALSGVLQPGDQLPSIRQLAVQLTVNPNTVAKVYRELEQEGLLETRQGRGCFLAASGKPAEALDGERREAVRAELRAILAKGKALGFSTADLVRLMKEVDHE